MTSIGCRRALYVLIPALLLVIGGCVFVRSYRSAEEKTLRDFTDDGGYKKSVGVLALTNTTFFTSGQVATPFMDAFISGVASTAKGVALAVPGKTDAPSFLIHPPRRQTSGELEVFALSGLARLEGMNAVASPILMNIRVRKEDTGVWFFKDVSHRLQIQTAAALYDAITGARLALNILTDEVEIDESQASTIRSGQETRVEALVEIAQEMGEALGEKMGSAIAKELWQASIVSIEDGLCVFHAGSDAGIAPGDRFAVLEASSVIAGLDQQGFIVPGAKIGEITISRVTPKKSYGKPESGALPPVGSVVVSGK